MPTEATATPLENGQLSVECAWHIVDDLYQRALDSFAVVEDHEVESELLFCLLGGFGITYEHGKSAAKIISQLRPFSDEWKDEALFNAISCALVQAQFEPMKVDGTLRRFRFPVQKASVIVNARRWLQGNRPLYQRLLRMSNCKERRGFLRGCPGIGPKTASWLLRNVGLGEELATIDIHILRALKEAGRIDKEIRLPRDYELVECAFLEWCQELQASPAAFDLFVWHWQRGTLRDQQ